MDLNAFTSLPPSQIRAALAPWLAGHIADPAIAARNLDRIAAFVATWPDDAVGSVLAQLGSIGVETRVYPAVPMCRALSREWARDLIPGFEVDGLDHLATARERGPVVMVGNHLSYFDSTAIDAVVAWAGRADLADRIVSAAGPKVYETLFRRLASSCLNTLPVPQSTSLGHTAQLSPRELARQALAALDAAGDCLDAGYILLLFAEGSRSRSGRLGSFLKGAHRYLSVRPGVHVVPTALSGSQHIMPVGQTALNVAPVTLRLGAPLSVDALGSREALEAAHGALAALLPPQLAPEPDRAAVV